MGYKSGRLTRRVFLSRMAALGMGAAACAAMPAPLLAAMANDISVVRTRLAMGTFVSIAAMAPSRNQTEEAVGRAFEEISRLEKLLSRFDPASPVYVLNDQGRLLGAPAELLGMVSMARRANAMTSGAFDPTVLPVLELVGSGSGAPLDRAGMRQALELTGLDKIQTRGSDLKFTRTGCGLTLDGVAKGAITDHAAQLLERLGIKNYLINSGGDLRALGGPKPGRPWRVAVQDPQGGSRPLAVLDLSAGAVASSGGYENPLGSSGRHNHIVSPASGLSPRAVAGATVRSDTAARADALSTAMMIMTPRRADALADSLPGCSCLLAAADGNVSMGRHWPRD